LTRCVGENQKRNRTSHSNGRGIVQEDDLDKKIWDSILRGTSQHLFTPKWLIMRPWKYRSESHLCIQYRSQDWKLSPHIHVKQDSSADAIKWLVYLGRLIQMYLGGILARNISSYAWRLMKDSNFPWFEHVMGNWNGSETNKSAVLRSGSDVLEVDLVSTESAQISRSKVVIFQLLLKDLSLYLTSSLYVKRG